MTISTWVDRLVDNRASTGGTLIRNFDSLRGIAALVVLSYHLGIFPNLPLGPPGVWLFFSLSGFLLYMGFLRSESGTSSQGIVAYVVRRIFRIYPLYVICIFTHAFLLTGWTPEFKQTWFTAHLLFLAANIHLWTIFLEMVFYLVLPLLVLLLAPVRSWAWRFAILFTAGCLSWFFFDHLGYKPIESVPPMFSGFLFGMAALHLRHLVTPRLGWILIIVSTAFILLMCATYSWARPLQHLLGMPLRVDYGAGHVLYLPCAAIVLGTSVVQSRVLANRWLRLIGICGYGIYLWHALVILYVHRWGLDLSPAAGNAIIIVLTLAVSLLTYVFVEKPGIDKGRKLARWIRKGTQQRVYLRRAVLVLALVPIFFTIRQSYMIDDRIEFKIHIHPSVETDAAVFVRSRSSGYSLEHSGRSHMEPNTWQTVLIKVPGGTVHQIRFDPGETQGEYRITRVRVRYPFQDSWTELDLRRFVPLIGVQEHNLDQAELVVVTQAGHKDPMLIYEGDPQQPFFTSSRYLLLYFIGWEILLLLGYILADKWLRHFHGSGGKDSGSAGKHAALTG